MQRTRYTAHTSEQALGALESLRFKVDAMLKDIRPDLQAAMEVAELHPDVDGEVAYLREVITEFFRAQLSGAFEAVDERFDVNPMKEAA